MFLGAVACLFTVKCIYIFFLVIFTDLPRREERKMMIPCGRMETLLGKSTSKAWKNHNKHPSKRQPSSTYVSEQRVCPGPRKLQALQPEKGDNQKNWDHEDGKRYYLLWIALLYMMCSLQCVKSGCKYGALWSPFFSMCRDRRHSTPREGWPAPKITSHLPLL